MGEYSADQIRNHIQKTFEWLNQLTERKTEVLKNELEEFFAKDLVVFTNGDEPLLGIDHFYEHIKLSLERYAQSQIRLPFRHLLIEKNKAALYYIIDTVTHQNESYSFIVIAIMELRSGKIARWWEVIVEKE